MHDHRIPTDASVVGFDDQFLSSYTLPPLTTVHHPMVEMGQATAEGLLRLLDRGEPMLPHFTTDLIIRKSAPRARNSD